MRRLQRGAKSFLNLPSWEECRLSAPHSWFPVRQSSACPFKGGQTGRNGNWKRCYESEIVARTTWNDAPRRTLLVPWMTLATVRADRDAPISIPVASSSCGCSACGDGVERGAFGDGSNVGRR